MLEEPVTAIMLNDLFTGKSVNTPGFLIAVLAHEKLIMPMQGKKRSHEAVDPEEITDWVDLLGSGKATSRKKSSRTTAASRKKVQIKKKATSRRKAG